MIDPQVLSLCRILVKFRLSFCLDTSLARGAKFSNTLIDIEDILTLTHSEMGTLKRTLTNLQVLWAWSLFF
jgi:hypothetical protein